MPFYASMDCCIDIRQTPKGIAGKGARMRNALVMAFSFLFLAAGHANADQFVADKVENVTLTASRGEYEKVVYQLTPSGPSALRAQITISELKRHSMWIPAFGFGLRNGNVMLSFHVVRPEFRFKRLKAYFRMYVPGQEKSVLDFDFQPRVGEPFTLLMHWTAEGKVTASVDNDGQMERHEAELGLPPKELVVAASNGSLSLTPLELGRMESQSSGLTTPGSSQTLSSPSGIAVQSPAGPCVPSGGGAGFCQPLESGN
jgi:hypothetical protein